MNHVPLIILYALIAAGVFISKTPKSQIVVAALELTLIWWACGWRFI